MPEPSPSAGLEVHSSPEDDAEVQAAMAKLKGARKESEPLKKKQQKLDRIANQELKLARRKKAKGNSPKRQVRQKHKVHFANEVCFLPEEEVDPHFVTVLSKKDS